MTIVSKVRMPSSGVGLRPSADPVTVKTSSAPAPIGQSRPIRPCVDLCVEVCEVTLEMLRVLVPRYLVDAWGSPSLQAEERPPKAIDVDVVQERCQSLLPVPVNGLAYAALRL